MAFGSQQLLGKRGKEFLICKRGWVRSPQDKKNHMSFIHYFINRWISRLIWSFISVQINEAVKGVAEVHTGFLGLA